MSMQKESCNATLVCFPSGCGAKLGPKFSENQQKKVKVCFVKGAKKRVQPGEVIKRKAVKKETENMLFIFTSADFLLCCCNTYDGHRRSCCAGFLRQSKDMKIKSG